MLNLNLRINFVKQLRIKISEKRLTQSFDVAMTSLLQHKITLLSSDKIQNYLIIKRQIQHYL